MKRPVASLLFFLLSFTTTFAQSIEYSDTGLFKITGQNYSVTVNVNSTQDNAPGAIISLSTTILPYEAGLSNLNLAYPAFGAGTENVPMVYLDSEIIDDSELIVRGKRPDALGEGNLEIIQTWIPLSEGVKLITEWIPTDTVHLFDDAVIAFEGTPFDTCVFMNTAGSYAISINDLPPHETCLQNGFALRNSDLEFVTSLSNPFHGDFIQRERQVQQRVMRTGNPRGAEIGPKVHSVLVPGDRIRREFLLTVDPVDHHAFDFMRVMASPSPHPYGAEGALFYIGDDFPLGNQWKYPTIPNDPDDPLQSSMVRILENFPWFKMSMVVIYDKLMYLWGYSQGVQYGWRLNRANISWVPFDRFEGNRSCRMEVDADKSCYVKQAFTMNPGNEIDVSLWAMIRGELTGEGGIYIVILDPSNNEIERSECFRTTTGKWQELNFSVAEGILLEENYQMQILLEYAGGSVFVDDVHLFENQLEIPLENNGFEEGDTYVTYDAPDYDWNNAHGELRLTNCPEEYKDFLRLLDSGDVNFGWENRMNIGLHAYHHTSESGFLEYTTSQEFTYNDPEQHKRVFDAIFEDAEEIDLSSNSLEYLRTSGIHFHHCTVQEAIKRGIQWMDHGYSEAMSYYPVYGHGEMLWMQNQAFWGDNPDHPYADMEVTRNTLARGGIAQWGSHPKAMLDNGDHVREMWFSSLLIDINDEFPRAVWQFPNEISNRAVNMENWKNWTQNWENDTLHISFTGSTTEGMSIAMFHPRSVTTLSDAVLDGDITCQLRFGSPLRTFIILPELEYGHHDIRIKLKRFDSEIDDPTNSLPFNPKLNIWPVPANGPVRVQWYHPNLSGQVELALYNSLGREVFRDIRYSYNQAMNTSIQTESLPSGHYFLRMFNPDSREVKSSRIVVLK